MFTIPTIGVTAPEEMARGRPSSPGNVGAWAWFDCREAADYEVSEDSILVAGHVLTLLWWRDESMILRMGS